MPFARFAAKLMSISAHYGKQSNKYFLFRYISSVRGGDRLDKAYQSSISMNGLRNLAEILPCIAELFIEHFKNSKGFDQKMNNWLNADLYEATDTCFTDCKGKILTYLLLRFYLYSCVSIFLQASGKSVILLSSF